jgi:hypothetical protein
MVKKRISSFPMPTFSKKNDKEQTGLRSREQQAEIETLLRQMVRNDFSIFLNEVTNGYTAMPARRRLIE